MKDDMKNVVAVTIAFAAAMMPVGEGKWYVGDDHCLPPKDDGTYSAPYSAIDHPNDYPVFRGADKPGWSCSYRREDGAVVQYGDSRTPQEQWLAVWGNRND
jgi:hypothetical protein